MEITMREWAVLVEVVRRAPTSNAEAIVLEYVLNTVKPGPEEKPEPDGAE